MEWAPKVDDVIGADHALVAKLRQRARSKYAGQRAEIALRLASRDGEALVIVSVEAGEDLVGGVEIAGVGEAEFADQAVLAGAPGALDAAFGLGREGGDLLNAEFFQEPDSNGWGTVFRRVVRRASSGYRCVERCRGDRGRG